MHFGKDRVCWKRVPFAESERFDRQERNDPVAPNTPEVDLDALRRVCKRYHVTELSVFGSAARGELRPESDVDLLVVFEEGARVTLFTLVDLQQELSDLFRRRVDVVPKDGLKPVLQPEILAEARILYAA